MPDKIACEFAKYLYEGFVAGRTIRDSFNRAKTQCAAQMRDLKYCCCRHEHKENCKWLKLKEAYI